MDNISVILGTQYIKFTAPSRPLFKQSFPAHSRLAQAVLMIK